ncbi:MAG: hypothetical protein ACK5IB_03410 [Qingshengfaniella sp.]
MWVVVPLAGPDFVLANGRVKATLDLDGGPLLKKTLESRPWAQRISPEKHVFVLIDCPESRGFAQTELASWYPKAQVIFLSNYTRGAAISALAGLTACAGTEEPLIIDLADILYTSHLDPAGFLKQNPECGGVALTFESDAPQYSYLRCDAEGVFVEAAEKRVISSQASAGTYVFSGCSMYLKAVAHALKNESTQTYNGLFYVCPLFNGVRAQGRSVVLSPVSDVVDIKTL